MGNLAKIVATDHLNPTILWPTVFLKQVSAFSIVVQIERRGTLRSTTEIQVMTHSARSIWGTSFPQPAARVL